MAERSEKLWLRYGGAVVAVVVAALLTFSVPLFRDRLTYFIFWPVLLAVSWLAGAGPALVATLLSAVVVAFELVPAGASGIANPGLLLTVFAFSVIGASAALLARWRAQSESALRESHDRFATVANSAPVLIRMSGREKGCTYFNKPWLDFTGRSRERELGNGWVEGVHPDDRHWCLQTYARAFDARQPFEIEYRLRRFDGEYRHILERGVAGLSQDGNFAGYITSATDITEQRATLQAAQEAQAHAEATSRAKDSFLATVSHELRAPLSPILTWARLLREHRLSDNQAERALDVIERNARTQAQLVEDLLDVARIVEGKLRLQVRPVALVDVINRAVEIVRPAADAKNVRLQLVLDTTVAAIPGDPDRLQQVMWNLLSNAVKFTPKEGRVHVVLEKVNSHVEIAVSDTGDGIPIEQLPRLFERFWQADSTATRNYGGLGLGLAIVRHLVELHGGSIVAESPGRGQGSTFTVKLPVVPLARTAGEETRRHPSFPDEGAVPIARLEGVRVLLVDDEPDANEALRVLLDHCGAEVRVAGSAVHALEILGRWKPDALVSDVGMPGEDGYALIAKVRKQSDDVRHIPAIALTAFASVEDRVRLLSAGFQMHVSKPADPGELTAAIASVLRRSPEK
jgi:PAS domain S-box-containing protein